MGIDCRVLVNSSPCRSISLILACPAPSSFLGGLSHLIGFLIKSSDSHMLLLRFMGMALNNSAILLNTRTSLKGLLSASLAIFHSSGRCQSKKYLLAYVVQYGASSLPKSTPFTLNTDLEIPSPIAILAILQSITALAVARNPLLTSKGVSGSFFMSIT
nr:hypothetical protein [Tanacetum cinerariifolium]